MTPPPGQPARGPTPRTSPPGAPEVPALPALDWALLSRALAGAPLGHAFHYLEETASTNDVARRLAAQGAPEGTVVVADSQTAGRGRAGKSPWLTPPRTSIAVSVLLRPPPAFPAPALPRLGMAAGVAAAAAVREETGVATGLKWPNDVLAWAVPPPGTISRARVPGSCVSRWGVLPGTGARQAGRGAGRVRLAGRRRGPRRAGDRAQRQPPRRQPGPASQTPPCPLPASSTSPGASPPAKTCCCTSCAIWGA